MIYICIPAHNEEQTVGVVLWKVRQVMAELGRDYQLLVADDGSTDRTPAVVEPYTRVLPLTVYRTETRRGYAAAVELLLREAVSRSEYPRRDVVVVLQADFTEDPQHVETLIKRIESGADIVASNTVYGGVLPTRSYRWGRAVLNRLLRRFDWPADVRDPLASLNAYRIATVKRAIEERADRRLLHHHGASANAELLRQSVPHARRIDVVELEHRRERLQRPQRFHFMTALSEVLALVRGRAVSAIPLEALGPDSVQGGRSLRTLVAESLRDETVPNGAAGGRPMRGSRRGGSSETRSGTSGRRRGGSEKGSGTDSAAKRKPAGRSGVESEPKGDTADSRPRRPRKRRGKPSGDSPPMAQDPVPAGTSETTPPPPAPVDVAAADSPEREAGQNADPSNADGTRKRRRRGSRGGRRRKRSGGSGEPTASNENKAPPVTDETSE